MKTARRKTRQKDPNVYPPGWNYKRAMAVAKYYDDRKNEDLIGDIAAPKKNDTEVWLEVPQSLLPQLRKLLAKHQKSA